MVAARRELRLARPGYDLQLAEAVLNTEGSAAVPCDAFKANLDGVTERQACGFTGRITFCKVMSRTGATYAPVMIHDPRALNDCTR